MRDAFVRAVMHDVPSVNYEEQAHKLAREHIRAMFKEEFPGINYDKACASEWFNSGSINMPYGIHGIHISCMKSWNMLKDETEVWAKLEALGVKKKSKTKSCLSSSLA